MNPWNTNHCFLNLKVKKKKKGVKSHVSFLHCHMLQFISRHFLYPGVDTKDVDVASQQCWLDDA